MPRPRSESSIATIVGLLMVNNSVNIENKNPQSVAVMISNLKKREEHKDKKFKVKQVDGVITVFRVL